MIPSPSSSWIVLLNVPSAASVPEVDLEIVTAPLIFNVVGLPLASWSAEKLASLIRSVSCWPSAKPVVITRSAFFTMTALISSRVGAPDADASDGLLSFLKIGSIDVSPLGDLTKRNVGWSSCTRSSVILPPRMANRSYSTRNSSPASSVFVWPAATNLKRARRRLDNGLQLAASAVNSPPSAAPALGRTKRFRKKPLDTNSQPATSNPPSPSRTLDHLRDLCFFLPPVTTSSNCTMLASTPLPPNTPRVLNLG